MHSITGWPRPAFRKEVVMPSASLLRWGGLASVLGAIFVALFFVFHAGGGDPPTVIEATTTPYSAEHTLGVLGFLLILFGVPALYLVQREASGKLGFIGFVLAFAGNALILAVIYVDAYYVPVLASVAPQTLADTGALNTPPLVLTLAIPGILWGVGFIIFAIATLRAGVLPRWSAVVLLVGAVVANLPPQPIGPFPRVVASIGGVVFSLGIGWMGSSLWQAGGVLPPLRPDQRPRPSEPGE
jgi:hypothetical protein